MNEQIVVNTNYLNISQTLLTRYYALTTHIISQNYWMYTFLQSQKAVSAYHTSKQILPFVFAEKYRVRIINSYRAIYCQMKTTHVTL